MSADRKQLIAHGWRGFDKAVISPQAPEIQRTEMRMAFYAGAAVVLEVLQAISTDRVSEEAGMRAIAGMVNETREYIGSMQSAAANQRGASSH